MTMRPSLSHALTGRRTDRRTLLRAGLAAGAFATAGGVFIPRASAQDGLEGLDGPATAAAWSERTEHIVSGVFLRWWVVNNRWAKVGQPVSEATEDDGTWTQYFEFGVLETEDLEEGDVTLLDTGSILFDLDPVDPPSDGIIARPLDLIAETWRYNGGTTRFGDPISDPVITDDQVVQWYERGAVAIATGGVESMARVVPVGESLARARDVDMDAVDQDGLDLLAPVFAGDGRFVFADEGFNPTGLFLPDLGVDAFIEPIGIAGGVMETPVEPMNVGWYQDHARPGDQNTIVMSGHVDWYTIGPAVFYTLTSAEPGMTFYVIAGDGAAATYECMDSYPLSAGASANNILRGTNVDSLTLITCTGNFAAGSYDQRQIVYAERI